jgi:ABC-2 type transport system ATP-binding protein
VLGFLGPNGAGKTTTMQVITGNLAPSEGRVIINGFDIIESPRQAKQQMGYLPEHPPIYREATVDEYLKYCAKLRRVKHGSIANAMEQSKSHCGLNEVGHRLIANLSKGYQQRVGIAQAIIHAPAVVILDEPTIGLDPIQIREIRNLIRELGSDHSVILSTHVLPEVQAVCDRVLIIQQGRLVLNDRLDNLKWNIGGNYLRVAFRNPPNITELNKIPGIKQIDQLDGTRFRIQHDINANVPEAIAVMAVESYWGLSELAPESHSLEETFIRLTCGEDLETDGFVIEAPA